MDEMKIRRLYKNLHDKDVQLFCSYTTRREGFLDILLSRAVLSSEEVRVVLGKVRTHRGSTMGANESCFTANTYISFSTGFVSFKYFDADIRSRADFVGGYGVFVPLDMLLQQDHVFFGHCSRAGGVDNGKLSEKNIWRGAHRARSRGQLFDDGYGNVFEVALGSEIDQTSKGSFPNILTYPCLPLDEQVIIAIPYHLRGMVRAGLKRKQEDYARLLEQLPSEGELVTRDREVRDVEATRIFLEHMIKPINIDKLPILWYEHRNLEVALMDVSIFPQGCD